MSLLSRILGGAGTAGGATIDVSEAWRRKQAGALLVDVREPDEWRSGHAPGATHVPLGALPTRIGELRRDRDVLLVCRSGNRSATAQQVLRGQGYDRTFNVTGGMSAWVRAGLPVER